MRIIDSDRLGEAGIQTMFFPGGEPHVKVPLMDEEVLLYLKLRDWAGVGLGALLIDALQRQGCLRHVFIPYVPAARQDKTDSRAALTLAVMGRLIGSFPISVFDPHSEKIHEYVNVSRVFMPEDLPVPVREDVVGIVAPDKGAIARATMYRDAFHPQAGIVECAKQRDPATGKLSSYTIRNMSPEAGRYIIVDDICDGGGTFNLMAEAFLESASACQHRCELELFVSHGLFSKGLDVIHPAITRITTTDSWCRLASDERLTVMPLNTLFQLMTGDRNV